MKPPVAIYTAFEEFGAQDFAAPEKNLMRAILQSAMDDYRRGGEAHREAKRYFSSEDEYYIYSFESICYHLDLCSKTIRTLLGVGVPRQNAKQNGKLIAA